MRVIVARLSASMTLVLLGFAMATPPASADEPGETDVGYLLVQQALSHLAHDTTDGGIEVAMEKVTDALETDDQEGVDVPTLERAMAALEGGDLEAARPLLQDSITDALHNRPPATGTDSGTTVVRPEVEGRSGLAGEDWGFLAAALVALVLGAWLTLRFRTHDSIRALRTQLVGETGGTSHQSGGKDIRA